MVVHNKFNHNLSYKWYVIFVISKSIDFIKKQIIEKKRRICEFTWFEISDFIICVRKRWFHVVRKARVSSFECGDEMNESIAMFELCNINVTRCVHRWKMVLHAKRNQLHGNGDGGVFVRNVWNICEKLNRQLWFCVAWTIERLLKFLLVDINMPGALQYKLKGLLNTSWKNKKGTHFRWKRRILLTMKATMLTIYIEKRMEISVVLLYVQCKENNPFYSEVDMHFALLFTLPSPANNAMNQVLFESDNSRSSVGVHVWANRSDQMSQTMQTKWNQLQRIDFFSIL